MRKVVGNSPKLHFLTGLLACMLTVGNLGCGGGPDMGSVQGTVMLGDSPFGDGSLVLVNLESGQGGSADLDPEGKFSLDSEIPVGTYTAYLTPKVDEEEMMKRMQEGLPPKATKSKLPKKYQNEVSSDLTVSVESGSNDVTLQMKP